ncbi:MAG: oligosaccharide flippase family protein [Planctomycetota bacterium]|nr:oligosaccharide flippase family protein [Planctomycetota bacterium]
MSLFARMRGSRFLRDSTVLQVGSAASGVASLGSALGLAWVLGGETLGTFYLAMATWSFLWFAVNLGLHNTATNQIASAAARGNKAKVGSWIAWMAKASFVIGLGTSVVAWLVLPPFLRAFYDSPEAGTAAAVLALTPIAELPRVVLNSALQGTRRMADLARVEIGQDFSRVCLVVFGAMFTGDAIGAAIGTVAGSLVGSALSFDAYRRVVPGFAELRQRLREVPVTTGLRLGVRVGLVRNIEAYGVQILPSMIIGKFGTVEWVAYLRLAQRLTDVARILMGGINRTALSHFSGLMGTQALGQLRSAYRRASLLSGALTTTFLLATLPLVPRALQFWPGDFAGPVWLCYKILVPGVIIVSFSVANDTFYLVTNTLRVAVILNLVVLVFCMPLTAYFAWRWPTVGTAIGLSVSYAWSLAHVAYAATWFRKHPDGVVDAPPAPAGPSAG